MVLVGESLGASRTLALARHFHAKYTRLVLVGGPGRPSARRLGGVRAVALLAGEREPQAKMREGAERLADAGIPARFWELAGATHGSYGPDGAPTMTEAVTFVLSSLRSDRRP
jgi:pimeloyl-ACP methyl ester carboxylesterase